MDVGTLANSSFKELVVPSDLESEVLLVALVFELSQTGDQDSLELWKQALGHDGVDVFGCMVEQLA